MFGITWLTPIVARIIGISLLAVALWYAYHTLSVWHADHVKLPEVEKALAAERACEKDTECDKKATARETKAAEETAMRVTQSLNVALASEETAKREAAAWRDRFQSAKATDPGCAQWAAETVRCPL